MSEPYEEHPDVRHLIKDGSMPQTFTGNLEWITIGGRIDVRHPDGRLIRASVLDADHGLEADRLGRVAIVTVEEKVDQNGNRSAYVRAVREGRSTPSDSEGGAA